MKEHTKYLYIFFPNKVVGPGASGRREAAVHALGSGLRTNSSEVRPTGPERPSMGERMRSWEGKGHGGREGHSLN